MAKPGDAGKKNLGPAWPYLLGLFWSIAWLVTLVHVFNLPPGAPMGFIPLVILVLPLVLAVIAVYSFIGGA